MVYSRSFKWFVDINTYESLLQMTLLETILILSRNKTLTKYSKSERPDYQSHTGPLEFVFIIHSIWYYFKWTGEAQVRLRSSSDQGFPRPKMPLRRIFAGRGWCLLCIYHLAKKPNKRKLLAFCCIILEIKQDIYIYTHISPRFVWQDKGYFINI